MLRFTSLHFIVAFSACTGMLAPHATAGTPEVCDRIYAHETLEQGSYSALCDCSAVTKAFIRVMQRAPEFQSVLTETTGSCAALTMLLTDPVTDSTGVEFSGDDLRPDPENNSFGRPSRSKAKSSGSEGAETPSENDGGGDAPYNGW